MTALRLTLRIAATAASVIAGGWLTVAWAINRIHDAVELPPRTQS